MSGGSYGYAYSNIRRLAEDIESMVDERNEKLGVPPEIATARRKFAKLLRSLVDAAHDIEWVDSGDYSTGAEVKELAKLGLWEGPSRFCVIDEKIYTPDNLPENCTLRPDGWVAVHSGEYHYIVKMHTAPEKQCGE